MATHIAEEMHTFLSTETSSGSWLTPQDRQLAQAVDRHSRFELKFAGGHREPEPGQPADQPAEGLLKLHPGELGAEAVMHARAEGQVAGRVAGDVEPVRIGEYRGVPVGRGEERYDLLACRDR